MRHMYMKKSPKWVEKQDPKDSATSMLLTEYGTFHPDVVQKPDHPVLLSATEI